MISAAGRSDLYALTAVGVQISTSWRTAVIPDVVVVYDNPGDLTIKAEQLALIVEVWSPGNSRKERETKKSADAAAGVPAFWEIDDGRLSAHYLEHGRYVAELVTGPGERVTVRRAAPVPVTFDPAELLL